MKYITTGKNMNVREALKERAEKKLHKIEKFFKPETEAHLTFETNKKHSIFEVTINSKGTFIRAEAITNDMFNAIDSVVDKLERQIRKNRTRLGKKIHQEALVAENFTIEEEIHEDEINIVRTKKFAVKPMMVEEAVLQMNLLGHEFFMFLNAETEEPNVVYKRNENNYGLIEPVFD